MSAREAVSRRSGNASRTVAASTRHKARLRKEFTAGTLLVCVVLGCLFGIAIFYGLHASVQTREVRDEFTKSQTGSIVFSSEDGLRCRQLKFDNRTGAMSNVQDRSCAEALSEGASADPGSLNNRMNSIRDAFRRK